MPRSSSPTREHKPAPLPFTARRAPSAREDSLRLNLECSACGHVARYVVAR